MVKASNAKTYMEKAMERCSQSIVDCASNLIETTARGVFITVCDNKTNIVIDGISLDLITNYTVMFSKDFPHYVELTLTVDMAVNKSDGYQFTDDHGDYFLLFKEIPIRYPIKNYSVKLREIHTPDLTVTILIPNDRFNLKINGNQ